jgi:ABC-type nickel/cobalt efflux system permease component RcnA
MKITIFLIVALSIGVLITISALQLLKIVVKEVYAITSEAWFSPEQH